VKATGAGGCRLQVKLSGHYRESAGEGAED